MVRTGNARNSQVAALAAVVMAWATSAGAAGQLAAAAPDDGAELSATVTVTRALLTDEGALVRELPTSRYRLARFRDGTMRMTMLAAAPGPRIGPLADPYAGMVVEGDLARGSFEVRDRGGKRLELPSGAGFEAPAGASEPLIAEVARGGERRRALERVYGRPQGRLRGLLRYVARRNDVVEEVLVAPDSLLPSELTVVTAGVLTEHHAFAYLAVPGRGWVRHRSTAQTRVAGDGPQRLLSVTELADIRTAGGGR